MNIPNILTTVRFFLIPIFVYFYYSSMSNNLLYAFIVFFIAGLTDVLDGYIARKFNMVTEIGKLIDPLADKFMLISVLICLSSTELIPLWILIIIIVKELVMVIGAIYLYLSKIQIVIQSDRYGKNATFVFYIGICLVLLEVNVAISRFVVYLAVILALVAFINYSIIAIKAKDKTPMWCTEKTIYLMISYVVY